MGGASGTSGTSGMGGIDDDGGIFDALLDPVPDAAADPISGTRLKAKYWKAEDGARAPIDGVWYDSQRKEDCSFALSPDGQNRCLPLTGNATTLQGLYADANCTAPVAVVAATSPGCSAPKYASTYGPIACGSGYTIYALGAKLQAVYGNGPGGGCITQSLATGYDYYALGAAIPSSSFVAGAIEIDP